MKNVHEFDRLLNISGIHKYTNDECNSIFKNATFIDNMSMIAQSMINKIRFENSENIDSINQCNAKDLCCMVIEKISKNPDLYKIFEEQLVDIYTLGQCPQGRVIRLWQLWLSIS